MRRFVIAIWFLILTSVVVFGYFFYRDVVLAKNVNDPNNCTPYNVKIDNLTKTDIELSWMTDKACISLVRYGNRNDSMYSVAQDNDAIKQTKNHKVNIGDLTPGESYYFVFYSGDKIYGLNGTPMKISTKDVTALD